MIVLKSSEGEDTQKRYRIIDAHCHIYPQKIAAKAVAAIGNFYDIKMSEDGTADSLIREGREIGVEKYFVHSTATTVHQVRSINDYIFGEMLLHPEFVGFMTLHNEMTEEAIEEEVALALSRGMKGVKLHPDFQKFNIDDAENIYRVTKGRLPVSFTWGTSVTTFLRPNGFAAWRKSIPSRSLSARISADIPFGIRWSA